MLKITVKTLDSQNHEFSVEDEITVREFKSQIAEKTTIAVENQRLIYCGRVLVDEKKLREYDVHGKVIHLVQRAPPSSRSSTSTRSTSSDSNPSNVRNAPLFRTIDGMVLGAMAIPTPQAASPSLNPSSTLCMNRITVARYMLECANNIAAYLEDPSRGLNNTAMDILAQQTMESTVLEVGISAVSDVDIPQHQMENIVQAFQGAVSAAFRQNGISNIRVMQQREDETRGAPTVQMFQQQLPVQPPVGTTPSAASQQSQPVVTEPSPTSGSEPPPSSTTTNSESNTHSPTGQRQQTTSTQTLAEVVQQMRNVQTRLEPFVQQYYDILLNDPTYEENDATQRENSQRVFDRVSEALHYMSHAQHAISDLMLDLSTTVPRHLCCRPILVEQSAFNPVIPIAQVIRNNNGNNNEATRNNNNNNGPQLFIPVPVSSNAEQQQPQPSAPPAPAPPLPSQPVQAQQNNGAASERNQQGQSVPSSPQTQPSTQPQPTPPQPPHISIRSGNASRMGPLFFPMRPGGGGNPQQLARLIQAVMNSAAPLHADVHVEINGGNMTASAQQPPTSTNSTAESPSEVTINIDLGENPQQARVTTATHPTTSTQTRSTPRPHVHLTNLPGPQVRNLRPVPANMLSAFDRFLPCNSHHIRENVSVGNEQHIHMRPTMRSRSTHRAAERSVSSSASPSPRSSVEREHRFDTQNILSVIGDFTSLDVNILNQRMNLLGQDFTVRDLLNTTQLTLNATRLHLLALIQARFFNGTPVTEERMMNAVNQGITNLDTYLQPLAQIDFPDYDTRRSIENLLRDFLPSLFSLIRDDTSSEFGTRMIRAATEFITRFYAILATCVGRVNAVNYLNQLVGLIFPNNPFFELQQTQLRNLLRRQIDNANIDLSTIREFIVMRRPAPGESINYQPTQPMETDEVEEPRPMNVDSEDTAFPTFNREETIPPPVIPDDETLPSVVIGSEPWHYNFPNSPWIPVITRDLGRQRRQSPQAPFSDSYISGMSSKRRKLISDRKQPVDIPNMVSEGIRCAISTTAVPSSSTPIAEITNTIAADPSVQISYKEALKSTVQDRLQKDPDFDAERFPNSSKFFNSKK